MARTVFAIYAAVVILFAGYWVDEYYRADTLEWYSEQSMKSLDTEWTRGPWCGIENPDIDCMIYLTAWRFLDNFLPSASEPLAPPPKLNRIESVKVVRGQEYYYDSWVGRIIKVDSEVQE